MSRKNSILLIFFILLGQAAVIAYSENPDIFAQTWVRVLMGLLVIVAIVFIVLYVKKSAAIDRQFGEFCKQHQMTAIPSTSENLDFFPNYIFQQKLTFSAQCYRGTLSKRPLQMVLGSFSLSYNSVPYLVYALELNSFSSYFFWFKPDFGILKNPSFVEKEKLVREKKVCWYFSDNTPQNIKDSFIAWYRTAKVHPYIFVEGNKLVVIYNGSEFDLVGNEQLILHRSDVTTLVQMLS